MLTPFARWVLVRLLRRLVRRQFGRWNACDVADRIGVATRLAREISTVLDQVCHDPD